MSKRSVWDTDSAMGIIQVLQEIVKGRETDLPTYHKLQFSASEYSQVTAQLRVNLPLLSLHNRFTINRNPTKHTVTIHCPSRLQRAFLARVNTSIAAQLSALRARGLVYATAVGQIVFFEHFPMGTTPAGGTTYLDACYRLLGGETISVALTVVDSTSRAHLHKIVDGILAKGDRRVRRLVVFDLGPWDVEHSGEKVMEVDRKRATFQQWRLAPMEMDVRGGTAWEARIFEEVVFRGDTGWADVKDGALLLPMQLFHGKVAVGRDLDHSNFYQVWSQAIRIPVRELCQILEEEEAKEEVQRDDWELANVEDADEWDMLEAELGAPSPSRF